MKRAEASQWLQRLNKKASFPAARSVRDARCFSKSMRRFGTDYSAGKDAF
jgi:hypothetical protein